MAVFAVLAEFLEARSARFRGGTIIDATLASGNIGRWCTCVEDTGRSMNC